MEILTILLLILAAVCFGLAAINERVGRWNPIALGLLCWVLSVLIPALVGLG